MAFDNVVSDSALDTLINDPNTGLNAKYEHLRKVIRDCNDIIDFVQAGWQGKGFAGFDKAQRDINAEIERIGNWLAHFEEAAVAQKKIKGVTDEGILNDMARSSLSDF